MTLYRPHRGSLDESMSEVVEIADHQALVVHLRKGWLNEVSESGSNVVVEKYGSGIDERIGWDTHIVLVSGNAIGFTDGPVPTPDKVILNVNAPVRAAWRENDGE